MEITVICSSTNWRHFLELRDHPDAEPHFQALAREIRAQLEASQPVERQIGEWHLPYYRPNEDGDIPPADLPKVCVGRCARVSYLTHDARRDWKEDLALFNRLVSGSGGKGHWSPLEHVAQAKPDNQRCGNFTGWTQYRKLYEAEYQPEKWEIGDQFMREYKEHG
jgi:thymidylate synthase ThyX